MFTESQAIEISQYRPWYRGGRREWLTLLTLALFPAASIAQSVRDDIPQAGTIRATASLVLVPTLVRSQAGDLVHTLTSADFKLTDNGIQQKVTIESSERQPLSLVVLMQTGASASQHFAAYANLGTMLDYVTGSSTYRVALVTFDSQPEDLSPFTASVDELKDDLSHPRQGDDGAAIFDAIDCGIDLLQEQPSASRRILILLSQTQDSGSKVREPDVVRRLGESNVTIYSVTFSPEKTWLKDQFTKPRHGNPPYQMSPDHAPILNTFNLSTPLGIALGAMRTNAASEIAALSGGESLPFSSKQELEQQLAVMANHVPNRYILSFRPVASQPGFHHLQVELPRKAGFQVAARSSYWVQDARTP